MKEFDFEKTPIVEIANEILLDGVKRGASDIHFDPYKDGLTIRMRVDGVLYDYASVPANFKRNMISRIKMIASMNIMETRLPQDGAIKSKIGDKTLDLRVSSLPTHNGEKMVLRILDYSKSLQGLETLGFSAHNLDKIIKMIEIPNGIVLVTGATGSGKSTTVYSILQKLNTREVNIITVEDPVEMEVEGLNQVQAQQEIGLDFATVLRCILRQDPDIIMIGEIRDTETARIAVRASITGHKVLSTIHTNNALNTIERLTDMDVERYLIGTSLNGIISQKLARKLCPHCRIARETSDFEKTLFRTVLHKDVDKVYDINPEGCPNCFKGYRDRIAIAEVLVITDDIRTAITTAEPKDVMRKLVYYDGHTHTLLEDGLEKIELGETNFEEIYKLVDLENDLAVAKSFYDEIEKDLNKTEDDIKTTKEEDKKEELPSEEPKYQEHNNIIEIDDSNAGVEQEDILEELNETINPSATQTQTTEEVDDEPLTEEDMSTPVEEPKEKIETLDVDKPEEILDLGDDDKQVETLDISEPEEILDLDDEDDNAIETLDVNKPEEILDLGDEKQAETLDVNKPEEILDLPNNDNEQVLNNPMTNETFKASENDLEEFKLPDSSINYDQMVKVPFVDETLDL